MKYIVKNLHKNKTYNVGLDTLKPGEEKELHIDSNKVIQYTSHRFLKVTKIIEENKEEEKEEIKKEVKEDLEQYKNEEGLYICPYCSKAYKTDEWFEKHLLECKEKEKEGDK